MSGLRAVGVKAIDADIDCFAVRHFRAAARHDGLFAFDLEIHFRALARLRLGA